jgi:hypothetical protein
VVGPPVEEFLATLTPAMWLLRGWLLAQVVMTVIRVGMPDGGVWAGWLPTRLDGWIILFGLCVASVQWGRGRWRGSRWSAGLRVVAAVIAVVAVLPVFVAHFSRDARLQSIDQTLSQGANGSAAPQDGVVVDGSAVSNRFTYDAVGNPLDGVQIFDDRGRPVRTASDGNFNQWSLLGITEPWSFLSAQGKDGQRLWNVYPLLGGPAASMRFDATGHPAPVDGTTPQVPPRPFAKAPAVELPSLTPGAAPGPAPSASPSSVAVPAQPTGPTPSP